MSVHDSMWGGRCKTVQRLDCVGIPFGPRRRATIHGSIAGIERVGQSIHLLPSQHIELLAAYDCRVPA